MQCAVTTVFLCVGLAVLLTPPTASQNQCNLPTDQDVKNVINKLYIAIIGEEDAPSVQELFRVHFTCLATVALDMYASATAVANFTSTAGSIIAVEQFQLFCKSGAWVKSMSSTFKSQASLPAMPFDIETQVQCMVCEQTTPFPPNYDPDSNCLPCSAECLDKGGGFCTGDVPGNCCPFFNMDTGACVDNCSIINAAFSPDENFTCMCSISCTSPGYAVNTTECTCELTDGCEAAGQPCQNGGTCISNNTLAPDGVPYYTCTCVGSFSGQNCNVVVNISSLSSMTSYVFMTTTAAISTSTSTSPSSPPTTTASLGSPTTTPEGSDELLTIILAVASAVCLVVFAIIAIVLGIYVCRKKQNPKLTQKKKKMKTTPPTEPDKAHIKEDEK